jgi:hypothetical protein
MLLRTPYPPVLFRFNLSARLACSSLEITRRELLLRNKLVIWNPFLGMLRSKKITAILAHQLGKNGPVGAL